MTVTIHSGFHSAAAGRQPLQEPHILEGRMCGYPVKVVPGKEIMAQPSSPVEPSTEINAPENWQFAYEEFRKVWSEEELSDGDLINALQYDVLSLSLLDGLNDLQSIRKTVGLRQLKEHLYYKTLNKVLTPEQRQGFGKIRQSFSARQLSDSDLLGALKHRVIEPGFNVERLKKSEGCQLFIDNIQQQAPRKTLEAFYRCLEGLPALPAPLSERMVKPVATSPSITEHSGVNHESAPVGGKSRKRTRPEEDFTYAPMAKKTKVASLTEEPEQAIQWYRPGNNSELYRDYQQSYIPALSSMFPKRRYDPVRSDGNCFYQSAARQMVALTGKPVTAKGLRRKMHLQAFLNFHQSSISPDFQKILQPENGGMTEQELRHRVERRTIITPAETGKGQAQSHLWGGVEHIPLLAYTAQSPVMLYRHSSQRMGEAPQAVCYNSQGLLCSFQDLKGGPRPIILVHNGVDHFDGMAPR